MRLMGEALAQRALQSKYITGAVSGLRHISGLKLSLSVDGLWALFYYPSDVCCQLGHLVYILW